MLPLGGRLRFGGLGVEIRVDIPVRMVGKMIYCEGTFYYLNGQPLNRSHAHSQYSKWDTRM